MRLGRVGEWAVPGPVEWSETREDSGLTVRMTFDVFGGRLECRAVEVLAAPGGREVRKADLRAVPIDVARDEVMASSAVPWDTTNGGKAWNVSLTAGRQVGGPTERAAVRALDKARQRLTDEDLRRVATIYQQSTDGAPTRAVAEAFGVKRRTARVYAHRARQAGLIPPVGASKPTKGDED